MKVVGKIISWIMAVVMGIFSLSSFVCGSEYFLSGIISLILTLFLVPPIRKKIITFAGKDKYKSIYTIIIVIVLFNLSVFTTPDENIEDSQNVDKTNNQKIEKVEESKKESKPVKKTTEKETQDKKDQVFSGKKVEGKLNKIDDKMVKTLTKNGYSINQATSIQKILNTLGIKSIRIHSMTGKAQEGLNAVVCFPNGKKDDKYRFFFTTEDGKLFYAGFLNEDLYDLDKGGYLKSYDDVHVPETDVTDEEFIYLQECAKDEIKVQLNYPGSADFHTLSWGVGRSDEHYQISGKVTGQNGFGVKDDVIFYVYFIKDKSGNFSVEGVTLNGIRVK